MQTLLTIKTSKCKKNQLKMFVTFFFFDNKSVALINLIGILRNPKMISSLSTTPKTFSIPVATYKLGLPISIKVFDFNKFANSLDLDAFLSNPDISPCEFANSLFINKYHNHKLVIYI